MTWAWLNGEGRRSEKLRRPVDPWATGWIHRGEDWSVMGPAIAIMLTLLLAIAFAP